MVGPIGNRGSGGCSRNLEHSAAALPPALSCPPGVPLAGVASSPGWATDPLSAVFAQKSEVSGQSLTQLTPYLRRPAVACARGVPPPPGGCRMYLIPHA